MSVPFAMRWEVLGLPWQHGSFTEAAKVRALGRDEPGEWWVERLHPDLKPEHKERVLRRWWLGARLRQPAWPKVVDCGDDGDRPWVVVEAPGRRADGAFRYPDPKHALSEVRGLALAMAEAEALLAQHCANPRLGVRPAVVARDGRGHLRLQLAALDSSPDEGFPGLVEASLFTPEELWGHPASARTNVFVLGWLAALAVTGQWPYEVTLRPGAQQTAARDLLAPLVVAGQVGLALPEEVKGAEAVLRRALSPQAQARQQDSAAFAEALKPFTVAPLPRREAAVGKVSLAMPSFDVADEAIPAGVEVKLLAGIDSAPAWAVLADSLAEAKSQRAKLIRAQLLSTDERASAEVKARAAEDAQAVQALAGVTPASSLEALRCEWKWGYVRVLEVTPTGKDVAAAEQEARTTHAVGVLAHPSLRFMQELRLAGKPGHARAWVEALQRAPPPALKRVVVPGVDARDAWALEAGFRFPKWTFRFGGGSGEAEGRGLGQKLKRLFGR
ncbi:MAG: hypothetical protein IT380_30065 [Myxococcales bacterium]|nr:hypothetical protein [Myxococcales bacterium]